MPAAEELVDAAREGRLQDLHDLLVSATRDHDEPPRELLKQVSDHLPERAKLPPRAAVVVRLLQAGAYDAAWLVVQDNAVGVVDDTMRTSTSSGARVTSQRLPLAARVEPPEVFAWLPGFRDPRYDAPDDAYRMTDAVTASVRLDEAWWDGTVLVLAGRATLRHLATGPNDEVTVVLRRDERRQEEVDAQRVRRPDLVRGSGAELTRGAWAGFAARVDTGALGHGLWALRLRLTQQGITREVRLGRTRLDSVPDASMPRPGGRGELRLGEGGATLMVGSPLLARSPRQVLQAVARRARGR